MSKEINIILNGKIIAETERTASYDDIIWMQHKNLLVSQTIDPLVWERALDKQIYTVTYDRGPKEKPEGSLTREDSVQLIDGMIINAHLTNNA